MLWKRTSRKKLRELYKAQGTRDKAQGILTMTFEYTSALADYLYLVIVYGLGGGFGCRVLVFGGLKTMTID